MDRRLLAPVLLSLLLTGACAEARDAAGTASDCAGLASDIARSGLSGVPTQGEAEQAVQRLNERVDTLESPDVREAASELRDRLSELQEAVRATDQQPAAAAAESARQAARLTAETCGLPVETFLGG